MGNFSSEIIGASSRTGGNLVSGTTALDEEMLRNSVLFVSFLDPEGSSPTSEGDHKSPEIAARSYELRCPHFRNKCGIKRMIQTSKIGYSTFRTPLEAH